MRSEAEIRGNKLFNNFTQGARSKELLYNGAQGARTCFITQRAKNRKLFHYTRSKEQRTISLVHTAPLLSAVKSNIVIIGLRGHYLNNNDQ